MLLESDCFDEQVFSQAGFWVVPPFGAGSSILTWAGAKHQVLDFTFLAPVALVFGFCRLDPPCSVVLELRLDV